MPSPVTWSTSGCSPSGHSSASTSQSPSPARSCAAPAEPAVVEHEPLDAHLGGRVGQAGQGVEVVVEVRRLPGVDQHRTGSPGARRVPAQPGVQPGRGVVQPVRRPGADQPRAVVALPRREHDLARAEQLAPAEQALALGGALGVGLVVAAPGDVGGPHLPVAEAEAGHPGGQQQGRVVAGAAVPALAQVGADQPRPALRRPLAAPAAGQVEQLGGAGRHRQRGAHGGEHQRVGTAFVTEVRSRTSPSRVSSRASSTSQPASSVGTPQPHHGVRAVVVDRPVPPGHPGRPGGAVAGPGRSPSSAGSPVKPAAVSPSSPRCRGASRAECGTPGRWLATSPASSPGRRRRARRPSGGARGPRRERARARCSRPPATGGPVCLPGRSTTP